MEFVKLLTKGKIGNVRLKNRVVQTAMTMGYAELNGEASERTIRYYEERAKGGVGLIITEIFCVNNQHGIGHFRQLHATNPTYIANLTKLADSVHKYGTKIFGQIHHGGNTNDPRLNGGDLVSASDVASVSGITPRPLTTEEVESLVQDFINTAKILQLAGFDGVEVHGAHGYLITQFMSRHYNKRTDKYGGSFENRMRFAEEIITGIRAVCGKDFAIALRYNGDDFLEGIQEDNITLEEGIEIGKYFEKVGVDALDVSCSTYFSSFTAVEPYSYQQGWRKHIAKAVKEAVNIPVIATNTIKTPEFAEQLLQEEISDFIGLGRPLIADPEWVNKAVEGRTDEIRQCIGCLFCFENLMGTGSVKCTVNPKVGCEMTYDNMQENGNGNPVAVIGGGPAGMQAATTLSKRGYDVTLYEKNNQLGGALLLAEKPAFKDKITALKDTLIREMELAGVEVKLGTMATPELVAQKNPVGVFIAAGARPILPNIPGAEKENVCFAEEVIADKKILSGKVAVIGSGMTGLETVEILQEQGCDVSIVEMQGGIAPDLYPVIRMDIMNRIDNNPHTLYIGHKLEAITEKGALLTKVETGEKFEIEADHIVLALGVTPQNSIVEEFDAKFEQVIVLGDARQGGRIYEALRDGYNLAFGFREYRNPNQETSKLALEQELVEVQSSSLGRKGTYFITV